MIHLKLEIVSLPLKVRKKPVSFVKSEAKLKKIKYYQKIKNLDNNSFGSLENKKELLEVVIKSDTRGSSEAIIHQLENIKVTK